MLHGDAPHPLGTPPVIYSPAGTIPDGARGAGWTDARDEAFRTLGRRYEEVVHLRAKAAAKLRAELAQRGGAPSSRSGSESANARDAARALDSALVAVRRGNAGFESDAATRYRRLSALEDSLRGELAGELQSHPAWPWLSRVHGVGPALGARLLARLDRTRARRPSAFWAYCGLATIGARRLSCTACGATMEIADGCDVPRSHAHASSAGARCHGELAVSRTEGSDTRVATTRGSPSQKRFDPHARVTCHLIGVQMVRTRGSYEPVYREAIERYARERPSWTSGRVHLSALRVMEKRFLLDLWQAWPATGDLEMPTGAPGVVRAASREPVVAHPA